MISIIQRFIVCVTCILAFVPGLQAQESPVNPEANSDSPLVYVYPFTGEVELGLVQVFKRGFEDAERANADVIIIETNTPGGRVDAALEIIDIVMDTDIPVYVYVTGDATSAGAIISIAADGIYMKPGTTIGTAAPVMMGGGESATVSEKFLSYFLAKVRSLCEEKGFSEEKTEIFLAMVDLDIEIKDPNDPEKFITEKGSLLTLTNSEAKQYGIAEEVFETREELLSALKLDNVRVVEISETEFEYIARYLSSITISGLLMTIAVIGLFWEFRTPGFGIPGLVGVIALALFFWGHLLAGLTGYEGLILFSAGLILVGLELFVIPGFGFTGIFGFMCMMAALFITLLDRPITSPYFWATFDWSVLYQAAFVTVFSVISGMTVILFLPFLLPALFSSRAGTWLMLMDTQDKELGYQSVEDGLELLLGKIGIAKSPLRPTGIASIDGIRMDVVSQGGFIPAKSEIEVVRVEGRRIIVKQR